MRALHVAALCAVWFVLGVLTPNTVWRVGGGEEQRDQRRDECKPEPARLEIEDRPARETNDISIRDNREIGEGSIVQAPDRPVEAVEAARRVLEAGQPTEAAKAARGGHPACRPPVMKDTNWRHTSSDQTCTGRCQRRTSARGESYAFDNQPREEDGRCMGCQSSLKLNKATRYGSDKAVIGYVREERSAGRGYGDILGISGNNYFDLFDHVRSSFTTADYPFVDCHQMPYDDDMFDYVISNQVFEHVAKPWLCAYEVLRVLKPGGHAIFLVPALYPEHKWPSDYWRVMADGMTVLLEGFSEIVKSGTTGDGRLLSHLIQHPSDRRSRPFMKIAMSTQRTDETFYMITYAMARK